MPLSSWTSDLETRYYWGLLYDSFIAFGFFINFGLVLFQAVIRSPLLFKKIILKFKLNRMKRMYQTRQKQEIIRRLEGKSESDFEGMDGNEL